MKIQNTQKKGRILSFGQIQNKKIINYLLTWIGNLGVVPLFLFSFFLLEPALFFLAALLLFVTQVLETILNLLSMSNLNHKIRYEHRVLPSLGQSVKAILCISLFHIHFLASANELTIGNQEEIIMTRGEVKVLKIDNVHQFNITNKEAIKYQYNPTRKEMIIKARQIGHSRIQINHKNNKTSYYDILIINKNLEQKLLMLTQSLQELGLNPKISGQQILLNGEIQNKISFLGVHKILKNSEGLVINNLEINQKIKKEVLADLYDFLLKNHFDNISCTFKNIYLYCSIPDNDQLPDASKFFLESNFYVQFYTTRNRPIKNYLIKFKIVQLEQLNGEEIRFGLEQLNTNLKELFHTPIFSIIEKNQIVLSQNKINLSTLAEPQISTELRNNGELSLGTELPFKTINKDSNRNITEWKFSGLKVKFFLDLVNDKIKLIYESELTRPGTEGESISGTKEKSSLFLNIKEPKKIFEITLKTNGNSTDQFPILSSIPILGELFKSKSKSDNYKTITGIVEVVENE